MSKDPAATCPIAPDQPRVQPRDRRKTVRAGEASFPAAPRVEVIDGVWHVRSLPMVREVLRAGRSTRQAGFNAEYVTDRHMRMPILFADGEEHRTQRAKIARYFAPKTVGSRYREFMETRADELIARIAEVGRVRDVELSEVTMRYSVEVAAQVVGLGECDMRGMASRLQAFFDTPLIAPTADGESRSRFRAVTMSMRGTASMGLFHLRDVRPAIKRRRAEPREDVISHLLREGYTDSEILTECVTYAAAGMVTTREFIGMAAWHLLENPELRQRYLADAGASDPQAQARRYAILEEILRLEPIVGHLYRRTTTPLALSDGEQTYDIPAGALLDLYVRQANADPEHVGEAPLDLCPARPMPPRVGGEGMSFGDGAHKCPGNHIAIQESDVFLTRLLALPLRLVSTPRIGWDDLIAGYDVRNIRLRVDAA